MLNLRSPFVSRVFLPLLSLGFWCANAIAQAPMAGTWGGTLSSSTGEKSPFVVIFTANGNPTFGCDTKTGLKPVEITRPGQNFNFIAPDGGIVSVTIKALFVSAKLVRYEFSRSYTKGGGVMVQKEMTGLSEFALAGAELDVRITIRGGLGGLSGNGGFVQMNGRNVVVSARLQRR